MSTNNDTIPLRTRREFLRQTVLGGAFSWTIPSFLANTLSSLQSEAAEKATQITTGRDAPILVVLQMAGGNDGLNMVVPYSNDFYHRARPKLGLNDAKVLKLNNELGLHAEMTSLKDLFDGGYVSIVQGVGYPNPNRSHFRSTEIWQTASDSNKFDKYGWLGRYFDNACSGCDPTIGVCVARQMPQAFAAKQPKGVSLENPQSFRFVPPGAGNPQEVRDAEESFHKLNLPEEEMVENPGGTVGSIQGSALHTGSPLEFLERTALDAQVSSDKIRTIASRGQNQAAYPASQLANSLKLVARLIGGGLESRVYYVSQGGYDTHTNQTNAHGRLLKDLGDSLKAFVEDLKAQGDLSRVMVMTFSEFGRRVSENASGGTDHGAAAPMFLIGNSKRPGLIGRYPSLAPMDLFQGDLKYTVDFRSVYASILESWLKTPSQPILGQRFPLLQIV